MNENDKLELPSLKNEYKSGDSQLGLGSSNFNIESKEALQEDSKNIVNIVGTQSQTDITNALNINNQNTAHDGAEKTLADTNNLTAVKEEVTLNPTENSQESTNINNLSLNNQDNLNYKSAMALETDNSASVANMQTSSNMQQVQLETTNITVNELNSQLESTLETKLASKTAKIIGTILMLMFTVLIVFWIIKRFFLI